MFRSSLSRHFRRISSNLEHAESRAATFGVAACRNLTYATAPLPEFSEFKSYSDLYKFSITKQGEFWDRLGKSRIEWNKPYNQVMDCDFPKGKINYFLGGELNASVQCVDRHVREKPNHTALIWERDDGTNEFYTFRELSELVNRMANVLMDHGVQRGHTVAIYLPNSPIAVATMLACSRIGAIHSIIYSGFSPESVAMRVQDAGARVLVTANEVMRGGRPVHLKAIVDKALPECATMKHVLLAKLSPTQVSMADITTPGGVAKCEDLDPLLARASSFCEPVSMGAEDPLFILYTSGSTGKPKGVVHTQAGYLLYAGVTHKTCFDINPEEDVFGCVADIGWITGHSYIVYGPLFNGCTTLLFESTPSFPDHGRYWATVEKLRLTHLYCAPTVLRLLIRHSDKWVHRHDRSSLRVLGSVGEPINKEAWEWYYHVVGGQRCDIVDTWWQTETGGVLIAPRPSAPNEPIFPAMPMRPFYGIEPALCESDVSPAKELKGVDQTGALCIKQPWPGIARTLYGDHARFKKVYFDVYPGYYATGDAASYKAAAKNDSHAGYYAIAGRTDDVINVSGIRIGTAEIESALASHPMVAESAVVDFPHPIKGSGIYAFVTLREAADHAVAASPDPHAASEKLKTELRDICKKLIARHAAPDIMLFTNNMPKTRSGKIMRRILRNISYGKHGNLGDTSTLADPHVVVDLVKQHQQAWTAFLAPKQKHKPASEKKD